MVKVEDIAKVSFQESVAYTRINANGKDGVLIAVIKQPNANLVDLSQSNDSKNRAAKAYPSARHKY